MPRPNSLADAIDALLAEQGGPYIMDVTNPDSVLVGTRAGRAVPLPGADEVGELDYASRRTSPGRMLTEINRRPAVPSLRPTPAPAVPDMRPSAPPAVKKQNPSRLPSAPPAVKKGRGSAPARPAPVLEPIEDLAAALERRRAMDSPMTTRTRGPGKPLSPLPVDTPAAAQGRALRRGDRAQEDRRSAGEIARAWASARGAGPMAVSAYDPVGEVAAALARPRRKSIGVESLPNPEWTPPGAVWELLAKLGLVGR